MADLATLALVFGVMPLGALALYLASRRVLEREHAAWAILAGGVAFLGIAHASATALEAIPGLRLQAGVAPTAAILVGGFLAGLGLGWLLLGPQQGIASSVAPIAWAGALYLAIHSFVDGFVLGSAFAGPFPLGWELTPANVAGTFVHRLFEGTLVVVPALLLSWKVPKTLTVLLAGLAGVPGAYAALTLGSGTGISAAIAFGGFSLFLAALESGFALLLLAAGYFPRLAGAKGRRWALWAALAFLGLFLVHFLVE